MEQQTKAVVQKLRHIRARSLGGWVLIGAAMLFVVVFGLLIGNSVSMNQDEGAAEETHKRTNDAALGLSVIGFALCLTVGSILLANTDKPIPGSEHVPLMAADAAARG